MSARPYSAIVLALCGGILIAIGLYFMLLRPPLLPEDLRLLGVTQSEINANLPGLAAWLQRVFWVLGGYIFATGALTAFVAVTGFRTRARGAAVTVAIAGVTSIGLMAAVNLAIDSDFKCPLLAAAMLWILALILYFAEGGSSRTAKPPRQRR